MELQFVKNILPDGSVDIFLYEEIGGPMGISGQQFAQEIRFLNEFEQPTVIRVRINSPGGLIQDGLSIIGAIQASKVPVDTYIDGVAASIAGVIAQAGRKRFINDFGRLMIHAPRFGTNSDNLTEDEKEALSQLQDVLATLFENNSEINKPDLVAIMQKDSWFNAELALNAGLVDEIVKTKRKGVKFAENSISEIYNTCKTLLIQSNNNNIMKNLTNHLHLDEAANEDQILSAVKNMEADLATAKEANKTSEETITDLNKQVETLQAENDALQATAKEIADASAAEFVENCIKDGKFKEDQKEALVSQAKNDFEGFKTLANSINVSAPHADITNGLNTGKSVIPEGREAWDLRTWEKKDEKGLLNLKNSNPGLYNEMYKAQYGVELS